MLSKLGASEGPTLPSIAESFPCQSRCPACKSKCLDAEGHTLCRTASQGFARLHQCRSHVWGTIGDFNEVCRSQRVLNRKEFKEELETHCDQASRRMRKAVGMVE